MEPSKFVPPSLKSNKVKQSQIKPILYRCHLRVNESQFISNTTHKIVCSANLIFKIFQLQGTSFPVWIYYRHFLDASSFFAKPWCASGTGPDRRATPFLTIPSSFCSFRNLAVFSSSDNSSRNARQYVAVTDGTRITVPKGNFCPNVVN